MSQPKQTQREHPNEIARRYGLMVLGSKGEAWSASNELGTSTGNTKREAVANWVTTFKDKADAFEATNIPAAKEIDRLKSQVADWKAWAVRFESFKARASCSVSYAELLSEGLWLANEMDRLKGAN